MATPNVLHAALGDGYEWFASWLSRVLDSGASSSSSAPPQPAWYGFPFTWDDRTADALAGASVGMWVYVAFYFAVVLPFGVRDMKKRAWIATALTSVISSAAGFHTAWSIVRRNGASFALLWDPNVWLEETAATRLLCINFAAFLFADLFLGCIFYPKYLQILTGWTHHLVYIGFLIVSCVTSSPNSRPRSQPSQQCIAAHPIATHR